MNQSRSIEKFTRARINKKFLGVFGGLENHYGISAHVMRLLFAVSTIIFAGWNIPAYFIVAMITKKEPIVPPIYRPYQY